MTAYQTSSEYSRACSALIDIATVLSMPVKS